MREKIIRDIQEAIRVKEAVLREQAGPIEKAANLVIGCLKNKRKLLFFGNGGSAGDSQHLAAEFVGRYERERPAIPAVALTTDTSILTAVGNDYGFDRVFERQIEALGEAGDVAFAISTSGNSPNVILGVKKARAKGLATIGLLGRDGGKLKALVDLPIVVPSQKTSRIQEAHILIGHILCERVDEALFAG
ncbi:MAG: D-sedoheptulose 7-phosphate isomerase [Candidatus Omnitrophica bacterium]|nr:D-sedoheptulose 7-phosphate isomerase [Candidatus Omnitrophota bacterium]